MELQVAIAGNAAAGHGSDDDFHVVDVKAPPTGGGQDHHVVDVDRLVVNATCSDAVGSHRAGHAEDVVKNRCVVCTEPMSWVAVGRCGHRVVCSKCMVTTRFFQQNKRCCICKAHCPKVLVAKVADNVADGAAKLSRLPRFAFRDGRVGEYWYHGYTGAYFEEEKGYQAARAACQGIIPPFYHPLDIFLFWFGMLLVCGALIGYTFTIHAKHFSSKVMAYTLSIFAWLLLAAVFWFVAKCKRDPVELEEARRAKQ